MTSEQGKMDTPNTEANVAAAAQGNEGEAEVDRSVEENRDGNPPEKDMMEEGSPPPEQVARDVSAENLDGSVKIEVEDGPEEEAADLLEALRAELAEAQAKADEYLDKMQRTAAEFQNSRRRQEKQMSDAIERANGELLKRLLPILDDFHLAFENAPAHLNVEDGSETGDNGQAAEQSWVSGFRQIHKKLLDVLTEQGLEMIDSTGAFDPALHEAIGAEPSDTVESGHIIETLRRGYVYKEQVLRPALVRVAA
jgi:molecular chaperone GrpE